ATSGASSPTTSPASGSAAPPVHGGTSPRATSGASSPSTSHITRTIASSTNQSIVPPTSSSHKTSQQLPIRVSLFFLSFHITNLQFNSSLENPSTMRDASFPSSAQSGSGVPGWGIALLVLVCVLVALAIIYLIALVVCQCRQKNYGQLDLFPTRDAYHPMSEYPTYHTHGRYVPPGSTKRSNGGSTLSYTNLAATSANL
uniref:Mucin 1, cell surface associated n=1 Tax=Balaenoptera musculus TaxID=9771 RepID=A0A8C0HU07_BALMU